jgi:hypothetical protein
MCIYFKASHPTVLPRKKRKTEPPLSTLSSPAQSPLSTLSSPAPAVAVTDIANPIYLTPVKPFAGPLSLPVPPQTSILLNGPPPSFKRLEQFSDTTMRKYLQPLADGMVKSILNWAPPLAWMDLEILDLNLLIDHKQYRLNFSQGFHFENKIWSLTNSTQVYTYRFEQALMLVRMGDVAHWSRRSERLRAMICLDAPRSYYVQEVKKMVTEKARAKVSLSKNNFFIFFFSKFFLWCQFFFYLFLSPP